MTPAVSAAGGAPFALADAVRSLYRRALAPDPTSRLAAVLGPIVEECCDASAGDALLRAADRQGNLRLFEWTIHQRLVGSDLDLLLLHSAGAERAGRAVLLPGAPGAGKSTLAGVLAASGMGYLGDEFIGIDLDTPEAVPLPKALTLKEGSLGFFPRARVLAECTSPPEPVRYIDPEDLRAGCVVRRGLPVGWIVFPRFEQGARAQLERLTPGETTLRLFESACNADRHKVRALDALLAVARRAAGYQLRFGDPEEARLEIEALTS